MRVLVVDDDRVLAETVRQALEMENYEVRTGHTGSDCLSIAEEWTPHLIILDIMMPGEMTGLDALRILRRDSDIPVILVSARSADTDKVLGLEYADDYLVKPFSVLEMLARVRARLRTAGVVRAVHPQSQPVLRVGDLRIDTGKREVSFDDRPLSLTATEYRILVTLAERPDVVVPRDELVRAVWGESVYVERHTVDVHIQSIRRKLEPGPGEPKHLLTVRGIGFRYVP